MLDIALVTCNNLRHGSRREHANSSPILYLKRGRVSLGIYLKDLGPL
jgi:hypothetical protein